jgi:hypothetical protein
LWEGGQPQQQEVLVGWANNTECLQHRGINRVWEFRSCKRWRLYTLLLFHPHRDKARCLLAEGEEEDLQHHHHQHQREQRLTQLTRERKGYLKMSQTKKKKKKVIIPKASGTVAAAWMFMPTKKRKNYFENSLKIKQRIPYSVEMKEKNFFKIKQNNN